MTLPEIASRDEWLAARKQHEDRLAVVSDGGMTIGGDASVGDVSDEGLAEAEVDRRPPVSSQRGKGRDRQVDKKPEPGEARSRSYGTAQGQRRATR